MRARAENTCPNAHILVDGTLKTSESRVNSLADFSRRAKAKGTKDIPVIYAFDLELIKEFDRHDLLKKNNYSRLLHLLRRANKARVDGSDWHIVQTSPFVEELIETLWLPGRV